MSILCHPSCGLLVSTAKDFWHSWLVVFLEICIVIADTLDSLVERVENFTMKIHLTDTSHMAVGKSDKTSCGRDHSPTVSNFTEVLRPHVCLSSLCPVSTPCRENLYALWGLGGEGAMMPDEETLMMFFSPNWIIHKPAVFFHCWWLFLLPLI